jgi:hypothetical protein
MARPRGGRKEFFMRSTSWLLSSACSLLVAAILLTACSGAAPYVPGLGEIMSLQQMRHTKLWLAGQARNWDLAAYEVDELGEGFDDVVAMHPTFKDSPVAPKDAIPRMVRQPLADLKTAVDHHDEAAFDQAYDTLTAGCNNCHMASNFYFNRLRRPDSDPYPDQIFEPIRK